MIQEEKLTIQKVPWTVVTADSIENTTPPGPKIKVRCIAPEGLYYGGDYLRHREGDVFYLRPLYVTVCETEGVNTGRPKKQNGQIVKRLVTAEEQFSHQTMERVDESEPERLTTAQGALNRAQDELNEAKLPRKR